MLKYKLDYYEIIVDYGSIYSENLPCHIQDKETDKIFYKGFDKAKKRFGGRYISGVRSEESNKRKLRTMRFGIETSNTLAPLSHWSTQDIFSYLHRYELPIHPNYAMLGDGRWDRNRIRVAEIGDISGNGMGRTEWEKEYYGDILRKIQKPKASK